MLNPGWDELAHELAVTWVNVLSLSVATKCGREHWHYEVACQNGLYFIKKNTEQNTRENQMKDNKFKEQIEEPHRGSMVNLKSHSFHKIGQLRVTYA